MKLKRIVIFSIVGLCCIFLIGCVTSLGEYAVTSLGSSLVETILSPSSSSKSDTKTDLIEECTINENTVQLRITVYQGRPGYLFTAFDSNNQELGKKFYPAGDEQGMKRYKPFKKMSTEEKKQFIKYNLRTEVRFRHGLCLIDGFHFSVFHHNLAIDDYH